MPLSLKDLIRRGDDCFFCGYDIGIEGQTMCPECGRGRPTPREIARVRYAITQGKIGFTVIVIPVIALGCGAVFAALGLGGRNFGPLLFFGVSVAVLFALFAPWFRLISHAPHLLLHPWRRRLAALYPWIWLGIGVVLFLSIPIPMD